MAADTHRGRRICRRHLELSPYGFAVGRSGCTWSSPESGQLDRSARPLAQAKTRDSGLSLREVRLYTDGGFSESGSDPVKCPAMGMVRAGHGSSIAAFPR